MLLSRLTLASRTSRRRRTQLSLLPHGALLVSPTSSLVPALTSTTPLLVLVLAPMSLTLASTLPTPSLRAVLPSSPTMLVMVRTRTETVTVPTALVRSDPRPTVWPRRPSFTLSRSSMPVVRAPTLVSLPVSTSSPTTPKPAAAPTVLLPTCLWVDLAPLPSTLPRPTQSALVSSWPSLPVTMVPMLATPRLHPSLLSTPSVPPTALTASLLSPTTVPSLTSLLLVSPFSPPGTTVAL